MAPVEQRKRRIERSMDQESPGLFIASGGMWCVEAKVVVAKNAAAAAGRPWARQDGMYYGFGSLAGLAQRLLG